MNPQAKRALRYAEYGVVTVLIVLSAYVAVNYALGVQTVYVVTDYPSSMSPTINYGDAALTYKAPFTSLHVGDIVFFHDPRGNPGVIVHRIIGEGTCGGQLCFQTKGDNNSTNPSADPWNLTAPYYLSQVILVVPAVGYVSPAFWGFKGLLVAVPVSFVALLAFFVAYGRKIQREETSVKREEQHG